MYTLMNSQELDVSAIRRLRRGTMNAQWEYSEAFVLPGLRTLAAAASESTMNRVKYISAVDVYLSLRVSSEGSLSAVTLHG